MDDNIDWEGKYKSLKSMSGVLGAGLGFMFWLGFSVGGCHDTVIEQAAKERYLPTNAHTAYVNQDSLKDLVYPNGDIYLQTPSGTFVSYDSVIAKEKMKIDSTYKARVDSIKNSIEEKLK